MKFIERPNLQNLTWQKIILTTWKRRIWLKESLVIDNFYLIREALWIKIHSDWISLYFWPYHFNTNKQSFDSIDNRSSYFPMTVCDEEYLSLTLPVKVPLILSKYLMGKGITKNCNSIASHLWIEECDKVAHVTWWNV